MTPSAQYSRPGNRGSRSFIISILIALVVLGWVIQGTVGLERTLFNKSFYTELMEDLSLYPQLQAYFMLQLSEGREEFFSDDSVIGKAVAEAVSEAWVRQQADLFISETLLFVKGQRQRLLLVVDLHERERVFRETLLNELLAQAPPQLAQLELPEAALREFVELLDFPDQVTLVNQTKEELPDHARRALNLLQLSRGLLRVLPYLLTLLLALLCVLWVGLPGGLIRSGGALLCSAVSYLLILTAARPLFTALLTARFDGSEALQALFIDGAAVLSSAAGASVRELSAVSYIYGGIGLALLAAGLAADAVRRRGAAAVKS